MIFVATTCAQGQVDTTVGRRGECILGILAGLSLPLGSPGTSPDLIPDGAAFGSYGSAHISLPITGPFGLDLGVAIGHPFSNIPLPDPLAARLYPDYYLLSDDIASFGTTDVTIGPTYRLRAGRWRVEPALLVAYSLLIPHDQRLFLKRQGSNEYRSILEETPAVGSFALLPVLTISYRLGDSLETGLQLRVGYLGTSFAISPSRTDRTLAGENHITIANEVYTHRFISVALGLYQVL